MRYFRETARFENIHKASDSLGISAPSISKAIQRLEGELGVKLFRRKGRNIALTPSGASLHRYANQLLTLEANAREAVGSTEQRPQVQIAGPEILLSAFSSRFVELHREEKPLAEITFRTMDEKQAMKMLRDGDIHYTIGYRTPPREFVSKKIAKIEFKTVASLNHPLLKKRRRSIPVEEALEHPFVLPEANLFGVESSDRSVDGWRDDKFPRKVQFHANSLTVMRALIEHSHALAYVPEYFADAIAAKALAISGCPYECHQEIWLSRSAASAPVWQERIWENFAK